jgi:hypothetical protein
MKRLRERRRRRRGRMEDAHHLNEIVIGMHWRVDVEDGVRRDTPEGRLDAPLDLLPIKPPMMSTVPSRGALGTILSNQRSTLHSWNAAITPAPVMPASTKRLTAWKRELIFLFLEVMGP